MHAPLGLIIYTNQKVCPEIWHVLSFFESVENLNV